jgi:hypothetical protein
MSKVNTGYDITAANYALRPPTGQIALYVTGSSDIVATAAMRAAHPDAILIDQSQVITAVDTTADAYDMENGAITLAELGDILKRAWNNYHTAARPGQRKPVVYASANNITPIANQLVADGLGNSGTGLWVAHYGVSLADAMAQVGAASGPFPIRAFQYQDETYYDLDVFDAEWVNTVSAKPVPTSIVIDGKTVGKPTATEVPAVVAWYGDSGATTRLGTLPIAAWNSIKWS